MKFRLTLSFLIAALLVGSLDAIPDPPAVNPSKTLAKASCEIRSISNHNWVGSSGVTRPAITPDDLCEFAFQALPPSDNPANEARHHGQFGDSSPPLAAVL